MISYAAAWITCALPDGRLEVFSRPEIKRSEVCEVGTYPVGKRTSSNMELSLSNISQYVGVWPISINSFQMLAKAPEKAVQGDFGTGSARSVLMKVSLPVGKV